MGIKTLIAVMALFGFGAMFSFITAWLFLVSPGIRIFSDRPGARKVHQKITPRIGGVSIIISFLLFIFIWHCSSFMTLPHINSKFFIAVIFGTIGIGVIGFFDDIIFFSISNHIKFLFEVLIAILLITISGIKLDTIYLSGQAYSLGFSAWPVTVLWLVGVTNALNIIDGVDGLAGMVALVSFITYLSNGIAMIESSSVNPCSLTPMISSAFSLRANLTGLDTLSFGLNEISRGRSAQPAWF